MTLSVSDIREILAKEICHPEYVKDIQIEPFENTGDFYCSTIYKAKLILKYSKVIQPKGLIIKTILSECSDELRNRIHKRFRVECFMYQNLTALFPEDLFPKYYLLKEDILVLEDLTEEGYTMGPKHTLDLRHLEIVLENLGRFHAAGLDFKIKNPERYYELKSTLFNPLPSLKYYLKGFRIMGLDSLRVFREKYPEKAQDPGLEKIQEAFENLDGLLEYITGGQEPWLVICHGDFTRNNILFKYNAQGHPIAVKIIDLQTIRLSSPAIDLSMILFLNTTYTLRSEMESHLINVYFSEIEKKVSELDKNHIYNKKSLLEEYAFRAFYGYLDCCDFIRNCLGPKGAVKNECFSVDDEEYWINKKHLGGKEADDQIAGLVADFIEKKYWPVGPKAPFSK